MFSRATPLLWVAGVAGALWLIFPFAYPGYDTFYALVWGDELAHGMSPDYGGHLPPAPHPLADLWGVIVSPLGASGAADVTTGLAYMALGAITYLVYRLGSLWFDPAIGIVAATIVITRTTFLDRGLYAHIDMPYIALALAALLIESRRPRAGWPVLALLAIAGLQRPEAWLFSAAYLAYMALEPDPRRGRLAVRRRDEVQGRQLAGLVALAASAPVAWAAFDLITTGEGANTLTGVREKSETLRSRTSLVDLVLNGPRRLGQVMQIPGLVGAAAGMALGLALMRRRALVGVVAAVLAGVAFAIVAYAGQTINVRFTMLAAAVLCVFCAAALLGWRLLATDHPWRRRWQLIAAAVVVIFVVQAPQQYDYHSRVRTVLDEQSALESDLHRLADSGAFDARCRPVSVPINWTAPRLAAWLDLRPSDVVNPTEQRQSRNGYHLDLADDVVESYSPAKVPPGFRRITRNESWVLYARCGTEASSSIGGKANPERFAAAGYAPRDPPDD